VFASPFAAPVKSSAARAAHRDARPLPHLFQASLSCAYGARTLGAWLEIDKERLPPLQYRMEQTRRTAVASQDGLARNKCGSGLASRCAAQAALGLTGAEML